MKKIFLILTALNAMLLTQGQPKTILGFANASATNEFLTEEKFDANLSAANIDNTVKELSSFPHNLGSAGGKSVALNIYNKYKTYGWDVRIDTYHVLFPTPKTRLLEMTAPFSFKALLKEPALKEDATSGQEEQLPTYNAWSADGDVTAQLVFVNYGLPDDYEMLRRMGIDVKGKIVIAKYGHSWRGIKPKVAQEHGAIGCIIYSDPADDGYTQGDVYPKGAFKNEFGVQRGSIMDMVIYPGDPLTPNIGATENANRIANHNDAPNLLKIPVLPISYHDAKPLLEALTGPVAPAEWRGSLPITYHVGPGNSIVHLKVAFNWNIVSCYDVIAMIRGSEFPDEWIIRGNHHDAWVNGANDPISGQAAILEEAKSIGELVKQGWKPKRTLVYCAWDGEEPGLLGSTEWIEDHQEELKQKCVLYVNSDDNGRGFLNAGGSQALDNFMNEIASSINDPQTNVSVLNRLQAREITTAATVKAKTEALKKASLSLNALGSGSDYSGFLQHLGLPVLDLSYGGEDAGGEYHSIYDSYDDYSKFKDPSFSYGVVLSKTAGHAVLRMADAELLPFNFISLYNKVESYETELITMIDNMRESTNLENEIIKSNDYLIAMDTAKPLLPPLMHEDVPFIDFSSLQNALAKLKKSSLLLDSFCNSALQSAASLDTVNRSLYMAEQQLLLPNGLPKRSWYKHAVYAPGFYTGYGVKTLPGIREAIEQRNWTETKEQINAAAVAINNLADYLKKIAE